jgi:hypothetical protein
VYDGLTARFTFPCPEGSEARVRLSAFMLLERLHGVRRPALYGVRFACPCGAEHDGLVTHRELDWAPLGVTATAFFNVMTGRLEPAARPLADEAAWRIDRGRWPWTFFCLAEERSRPVFPSAFRVLFPEAERMLVAVECPTCARTSANVVSHEHLDVPFYSDHEVEVVEHLFESGEEAGGLAGELTRASFERRSRSLT